MHSAPLAVTIADRSSTAPEVRLHCTRRDAAAALAALHARGFNVDSSIEIVPASDRFSRGWTVSRVDHFNGITFLMTDGGAWVPGRLSDASPCWCTTPCRSGHPAPWARLGRPAEQPTFTHVTRTVPDTYNRHERYRTKSNGSCGRWITTDDSVAVCVCGWKQWEPTREAARWAARTHREKSAAAKPVGTGAQ